MENYKLKLSVQHSDVVVIEAESESEAIDKATKQYTNGEIMPTLKDSKYYDGLLDVRVASKRAYKVRVLIQHSDIVELDAESELDAIQKVTQDYYKGSIMTELADDTSYNYYDGLTDIDIIDEGEI